MQVCCSAYAIMHQTQYTVDDVIYKSCRRIQRWTPGATYGITLVSSTMSNPRGMTLDNVGNLVVADMSYYRISSFSISCRKLND